MLTKFKIISILVLVFAFVFIAPASVYADGMIIRPDPYKKTWDYYLESDQQAFINYENGLQKMVLSMQPDSNNETADATDIVWLFPVPAEPDKVVIEMIDSLPQLDGQDISEKAKSNLEDLQRMLFGSQLYTIPFIDRHNVTPYYGIDDALRSNFPGGAEYDQVEEDVVVHESIESDGITTEILTAKTANGLYDYLEEQGVEIEKGSIPVLDDYIGKDYSFVASWVSEEEKAVTKDTSKINTNEAYIQSNLETYIRSFNYPGFQKMNNYLMQEYPDYGALVFDVPGQADYLKSTEGVEVWEELYSAIQENPTIIESDEGNFDKFVERSSIIPEQPKQRGVFVTFPTTDLYFPLMPTSVYGSESVPATIRVLGYVTPEIYSSIESYTEVAYYLDPAISIPTDLKNFYSGDLTDVKYTKIELNTPSKYLVDDLWMKRRAPVATYLTLFFAQYEFGPLAAVLILASLISSILFGMLIFKSLRNFKGLLKLGLIGILNIFSIAGVMVTTMLVRTKEIEPDAKGVITAIKEKGYFWRRRTAVISLLSSITLIVIFFSYYFITNNTYSFRPSYMYYNNAAMIIILILPALLLASIVFMLAVMKIQREDRELFDWLEDNKINRWTFLPIDRLKYVFVPLFSVAFLGLGWLLVKIVEVSV